MTGPATTADLVGGSPARGGRKDPVEQADTGATAPRVERRKAKASVTVIVATRDRPELLRRAVSSILVQRYGGPVEVIAVFDQSAPDHALALDNGDTIRHRSVRVLTNSRSPGLAGARNTGLLEATTDLVAFCDDDDLWSPGKLDAQVELLTDNPLVEVVTCGLFVEARGRITPRVLDRDRVTFTDLIRSRVMEAHPSTYLARRSAVLGNGADDPGIGLVDEELPGSYAEDYDWLLRAARRTDIGAVELPFAKVVWHRSSFFSERWETILDALDYMLAKHPELREDPAGLARIEGQQAFALAALRRRREAQETARRCLGHNRSEKRAWLALAVTVGIRPELVIRALQAFGRGI